MDNGVLSLDDLKYKIGIVIKKTVLSMKILLFLCEVHKMKFLNMKG